MFGAKLSWCQIVRCQIVLVPNCPGAKLSAFIILVPNCPLLLSWCQIVRFIILVPNCPVPNCPTICENTFGWQYPYSVQHSAHPGHPSTWSSSSLGVLLVKIIANALWTKSSTTHNISFEEFEARWLDLNGAAAQDPVPVPAPRHPASMYGTSRRRSAWFWQWL